MTGGAATSLLYDKPAYGLREVEPGVVEIMAHRGRAIALAWLAGIAVIAGFAFVAYESPDFISRELSTLGYGIAWGPETKWISGYEACQRTPNFYPGCHPDVTPWEYVLTIQLPLSLQNGQLLLFLSQIMLLLSPWLVILSLGYRRPLRLDGHRRVCYTWHRGRLFIAPSGFRLESVAPRRWDMIAGDKYGGPVLITLARADNPDVTRRFAVGVFTAGGRGLTPEEAWSTAQMVYGHDAAKMSAAMPPKFRLPWWQRLNLRSVPSLPSGIEEEVDRWLAAGGRELP